MRAAGVGRQFCGTRRAAAPAVDGARRWQAVLAGRRGQSPSVLVPCTLVPGSSCMQCMRVETVEFLSVIMRFLAVNKRPRWLSAEEVVVAPASRPPPRCTGCPIAGQAGGRHVVGRFWRTRACRRSWQCTALSLQRFALVPLPRSHASLFFSCSRVSSIL